MKYCNHCGQQLADNAVYCPRCGKSLTAGGENPNDTGSVGWGFLGFFIPVVGIILYFLWKREQPKNAKRAGVGALVSIILSTVFSVIYFFVILYTTLNLL
ncbi:MAG: zinc ribbon domain-containing protein [Candidatus Moranbacteria bacterium]|nr:zinc ribbon domain-containing protein [Candidatus Moranbacteria bacterium]